MKKIIIYLLIAMTIFTVMTVFTLPEIKAETNDLEVFDLRPEGYTVEEGQEILDNLSQRGQIMYRYVQLPLDFLYPLFLYLFAKLRSWVGRIAFPYSIIFLILFLCADLP